MTGQKYENYPAFDFVGNRVNDLDNFKVGDLVTISFALNGRPFDKEGKIIYITSVTGYKIESYRRQNSGYKPSNADPSTVIPSAYPHAQQQVQNAQQQTSQPFPPNSSEVGRTNDEGNLPF